MKTSFMYSLQIK